MRRALLISFENVDIMQSSGLVHDSLSVVKETSLSVSAHLILKASELITSVMLSHFNHDYILNNDL